MMGNKTRLSWAVLLTAVAVMVCPVSVTALEDDEGGPPRRERMKRPGLKKIQERIERLREEGVAEDDPRIERLQKMLEAMEEGGRPDFRGGSGGRDGEGRFGGAQRRSPEEIRAFVEKHPQLRGLLAGGDDEASARRPQHIADMERRIAEIMTAKEEGKDQLASALIENVKLQVSIGKKLREYHQATAESAERSRAREELSALVRQQVQADLGLEELKLQDLRERLAQQESRLAEDRTHQEELAAEKLEHLLSKKPGDKAKRFKPGRFGPHGEDDEPAEETEPQEDQ